VAIDYGGRWDIVEAAKKIAEDFGGKKVSLKDFNEKTRLFFEQHPLKNQIGIFEGAGYNFNGMYRPALECLMFSNRQLQFDTVCSAAIKKRIYFLSQNK